MQTFILTPRSFVIRNGKEMAQLQKILPHLGLKLKEISWKKAIKLQLEEDSDESTASCSEDEQADDLPNSPDTKGANPLA